MAESNSRHAKKEDSSMDYDGLIRNWHTRAGEEDYFSKFVFEYLAFIAYVKTKLYFSRDSERTVTDRNAIQQLKRDADKKRSYLDRIHGHLELRKAWEKIKNELDHAPLGNVSRASEYVEEIKWWNCSHANLNEKTPKEESKISGVLHSLDDWENMIEFWYSIRNNLFHGGKDPEKERDQLAVEFGYKTLRELVTMLLYESASPRL